MNEDFNEKIRELKIWAKLSEQDYCVQYRSAWLEKDENTKEKFLKLVEDSLPPDYRTGFMAQYRNVEMAILHIQMDLCSFSLTRAIKQMFEFFNFNNNQVISNLAFYMASSILVEILESIDFLHKMSIIHRDIKPDNFLVKFSSNGRCIKLGDFGLAVLHNAQSQSHTQNMGTERYMAPEVRQTRKYTPKADIYSIGVIIQRLFNFDINRQEPKNLPKKFQTVIDMSAKMLCGVSRGRPTCAELLNDKNDWTLDYIIVEEDINRIVDVNANYDIRREFVQKFFQNKMIENQNNYKFKTIGTQTGQELNEVDQDLEYFD